jgi:DNA-binding beta-propeller fold protein YncE
VPAVEKGFISNGDNNTVTVFNYATLESIATINIHGQHPDPMCYDEFSKKLFVFCDNNLAVVVDPTTNKEVDSIKLGGAPEYALPDNKGLIYNNLEDKDAIAVIDVQKKKVINNYRLSNKSAPTGLAMDVKNDRLFVACRGINRMSVVDAHSGRIIISLPIGGMADGIWFDDKTHYIFCSNGDGTTTIIRQETKDEYKVIDNITTKIGAKTMALDMKSHNIYLSSSDYEKGFPVIIPGTFAVLVYKMN